LPVYDLDDIARSLGSPRTHNHHPTHYDRAGKIFAARVRKAGDADHPAVFIRCAPTRRQRDHWRRVGRVTHTVILIPPLPVLTERAQARYPHHNTTTAVIRKWMTDYTPDPPTLRTTIIGTPPTPGPHHAPKPPRVYADARWTRVRKVVLQRDGHTCTHPGCGVRTGLEVDHIIRPLDGGAAFDPQNLTTLCGTHHRRKTARDKQRRDLSTPPHNPTTCPQCTAGMVWDGFTHASRRW
jgi:hypothetical protein